MIRISAATRAALLATSLTLLLTACSKRSSHDPGEAHNDLASVDVLTVYAVNYPLAYFARRLAPEGARVELPVPGDVDPAFWRPSADEVQAFQQADLILLNGAGYARWTRYATLPGTRLLVTSDGCRENFLTTVSGVQHQHGPEGEHAHSGVAFTTWLDMRLALCQARRIRDALSERLPEQKAEISSRFELLERELLDLDSRLRLAGKAWGGRALLASHPVYQYLADAYGLSIRSLHFEPDQELSDANWDELEALLRDQPSAWMLWEAPPLSSTAQGLGSRGVAVLVFEPAGNAPAEGDFLTVMQANVKRLECASGVKPCL